MIEVNLLPGGKKRRPSKSGGGGGFLGKLSMPSLGSLALDAYSIAAVVVVVGVLATLGYWYMGLSSRQEEVQVQLADAVQDSSNYSDLIQQNESLMARRDSIALKVDIIQEIDALRYVWPHLLDEVARALPDFTWLTEILQVSGEGAAVEFQIRGLAGNNFAMTTFWEQLEESPFIRDVMLVQSEQILQSTGQMVVQFQLDCVYSRPSMDFLETIPLFGEDLPALNQ
ncbi:MAG: PilN domain-containing protein [Gemmatimonadetes bacterium]|nr:PilN domain-containing protein [Gemmatimonadota bacterium]